MRPTQQLHEVGFLRSWNELMACIAANSDLLASAR
jgi:hypothetical protein